jgi:multidrug efflux pump subunit AcrB
MLSWFSALTITPVLIKWWLFKGAASPPPAAEADPYRGRFTAAISGSSCCGKKPSPSW